MCYQIIGFKNHFIGIISKDTIFKNKLNNGRKYYLDTWKLMQLKLFFMYLQFYNYNQNK